MGARVPVSRATLATLATLDRSGHCPAWHPAGMTAARVDIVDETYLRVAPAVVRGWFDDEERLMRLWPHLHRTLVRDRGVKGLRWTVDGAVVGEMEVWIEPWWDGVILHHYVRGTRGRGAPADVARRHQLRWKRAVHALKDRLEEATL